MGGLRQRERGLNCKGTNKNRHFHFCWQRYFFTFDSKALTSKSYFAVGYFWFGGDGEGLGGWKGIGEGVGEGLEGGFALRDGAEGAFPYHYHVPAEGAEGGGWRASAGAVGFDFGAPEVGVGFGEAVVLAVVVAVPEAAVDEYYRAQAAEHYVGASGEFFVVEAVAVAKGMEVASHEHLGLGVVALDCGHAAVALLRGHCVCHTDITHRASIVLYGLDERHVGGLAGPQGVALGHAVFVDAVAYAGAEGQRLGLAVEALGLGEKQGVVVGEICLEAFGVAVEEKFYRRGVVDHINFY